MSKSRTKTQAKGAKETAKIKADNPKINQLKTQSAGHKQVENNELAATNDLAMEQTVTHDSVTSNDIAINDKHSKVDLSKADVDLNRTSKEAKSQAHSVAKTQAQSDTVVDTELAHQNDVSQQAAEDRITQAQKKAQAKAQARAAERMAAVQAPQIDPAALEQKLNSEPSSSLEPNQTAVYKASEASDLNAEQQQRLDDATRLVQQRIEKARRAAELAKKARDKARLKAEANESGAALDETNNAQQSLASGSAEQANLVDKAHTAESLVIANNASIVSDKATLGADNSSVGADKVSDVATAANPQLKVEADTNKRSADTKAQTQDVTSAANKDAVKDTVQSASGKASAAKTGVTSAQDSADNISTDQPQESNINHLRAFLAGLTLAVFAALCVLGIITVEHNTAATIQAYRDIQEQKLLSSMLPQASQKAKGRLSYQCKLLSDPRIGKNMQTYIVHDESGQMLGIIANYSTSRGYSNPLILIAGVDLEGHVQRVEVKLSKETPGIGDKVEYRKGNYLDQFINKGLDNANWEVKKFGGEFDYFTGATVTSRAVVLATRDLLQVLKENAHPDLLPDCR